MMKLEYRQAQAGKSDRESRTISGIAVPFNRETEIIPGYFEKFSPGAITVPAAGCKLLSEHRHAIGTVQGADTDAGWSITGKVANIQRGDDALELATAGVYTGLSVGFEMRDFQDREDENGDLHRTVTGAVVREVSLTPFPAYEDAQVLSATRTKQKTPTERKNEMSVTIKKTQPESQTVEVHHLQESVDDLTRAVQILQATPTWKQADTGPGDNRSAATFLKSALGGNNDDLSTLGRIQERAYAGGTSKDNVPLPQWVGDLTRLVDQGAGIRNLFATGNLPAEGFKLEYAQLKANTLKVERQLKEGDNLATGNISVETKAADIYTFGGATTLSRQEIERGHVRILDHHLRGMALAAGTRARAEFYTTYQETVAAAEAAGSKVTGKPLAKMTWTDWVRATVGAAKTMKKLGLVIENLICDEEVFITLATLESPNKAMMSFANTSETTGQMNIPGLKGNLLSIPVILDEDAPAPSAVFQNSLAIRSYMSNLVRLQDENIMNLSRDFSVYFYGGFAQEIPQALVPVTGLVAA